MRFFSSVTAMAVYCQVLLLCATSLPIAAAESTNDANDLVELTNYQVTTNVESRLLKTIINMTFLRRDVPDGTASSATTSQCGPIIHTMTLQLPRMARVQSLQMDLANGCQLDSEVQGLEQAQDTFDDMASSGKPAAILTAWDMSNYKLQVVLPAPVITADNTTNVTLAQQPPTMVQLTYTELLVQKNHQVDFQLPVFPGIAVSDLTVDVSVQDLNAGVLELVLDSETTTSGRKLATPLDFTVEQQGPKLALAHFEQSKVPDDSQIPRLIRGFFRPASLPDAGVLNIPLVDDGKDEICFTHVFNPSDFLAGAGSLAKNIVFVIDTSGSMSGQRLGNAKAAFVSMVNALQNEKDVFSVQTFASSGTEVLWGPNLASASTKQEGINLVQSLRADGGTNLHDAYLDGIRHTTNWSNHMETVSVLVVLSDGEASSGITDRSQIARNVKENNADGRVKIFSLAFGESADVDLLTGIALQNGGKVLQIYEGYGDTVQQMEDFYQNELEQIVLSDIHISYFKNAQPAVGVASTAFLSPLSILDLTSSQFPTLAGGSECVVRGKIPRSELPTNTSLQASVSALSAVGSQEWSQEYDFSLPLLDTPTDNPAPPTLIYNDCEQSFAHARIEELLTFRNAQRALGNDLQVGSGGSSLEEQARQIAIEAQLVWPGLTALVTLENSECPALIPQNQGTEEEAQVCYSGESSNGDDGGAYFGEEDQADTTGSRGGGGYFMSSGGAYFGEEDQADTTGSRGGGGYYSMSSASGATLTSWWSIAALLSLGLVLLR